MKILHVGFYDSLGGAAKAMLRIHNSLNLHKKVDSKIVVINKLSTKSEIIELKNIKFKFYNKFLNQLKKIFLRSNKSYKSFNVIDTKFVLNFINNHECDIVNFHWIGSEMISLKEILKINKKIVWTFHDMWPFLGMNHYEEKNNLIINYFDKILKNKKKLLTSKKISIIFPSNWMKNKFFSYKTYNPHKYQVVHYPIDINFWNSKNPILKTYEFKFKKDIEYILFISNSGNTDLRKGYNYLLEIIINLSKHNSNKKLEFIILGSDENKITKINEYKLNFIKRTSDELILKYFYINSTLTLLLSSQDNLPLVMQESLACGTPLITFDNGGMTDLVIDDYNGFIINNYDINLASMKLLEYINFSSNEKNTFKKNAMDTIFAKCSEETISNKLINFYLKL